MIPLCFSYDFPIDFLESLSMATSLAAAATTFVVAPGRWGHHKCGGSRPLGPPQLWWLPAAGPRQLWWPLAAGATTIVVAPGRWGTHNCGGPQPLGPSQLWPLAAGATTIEVASGRLGHHNCGASGARTIVVAPGRLGHHNSRIRREAENVIIFMVWK